MDKDEKDSVDQRTNWYYADWQNIQIRCQWWRRDRSLFPRSLSIKIITYKKEVQTSGYPSKTDIKMHKKQPNLILVKWSIWATKETKYNLGFRWFGKVYHWR